MFLKPLVRLPVDSSGPSSSKCQKEGGGGGGGKQKAAKQKCRLTREAVWHFRPLLGKFGQTNLSNFNSMLLKGLIFSDPYFSPLKSNMINYPNNGINDQ